MPKQIPPLLGKKWLCLPVIRKYLDEHPGSFYEVETLPLIDVASQRDFFVRPKGNAEGIREFGRLFFRRPVEPIELLSLIQERLADNYFHTVRIERYFDTHGMGRSDSKIADFLNEEARQRHGDNYAVEGIIKKEEVAKERRNMIKERKILAPGQTPEAQQFYRDGIISKSRKPSRGGKK